VSLRLRFALFAAAAVTAAAALVAVAVYYLESQDLRRSADIDLHRETEAISARLDLQGTDAAVIEPDLGRPYRLHAQLVAPDSTSVPLGEADVILPVTASTLSVAAEQGDRFYSDVVVDGEPLRVLTVPVPEGALVVARSTDDIDLHLQQFATILLLVVAATLGVAVLLGDLVARAALRPITSLSAAAERISRDRTLRRRLDVGGPDELGRLARSINSLLDTLDVSLRSQTQLVADASHELRTPLSSIWTNLEVLDDGHRLTADDVAHIQADVRAEVSSLIAAAGDLLELASDAPTDLITDELSLDELVQQVVVEARRRWPDLYFDLSVEPCLVTGDGSQIRRLVSNLVENAAKWSPPGGQVEVRVDAAQVSVRDHGPGIPAEDLPHVFERFYRGTSARALPGAGLGLAIVRKLADQHGWRTTAENCPDGGACFRVWVGEDVPPGLTVAGRPAGTKSNRRRLLTSRPVLIATAFAVSAVAVVAVLNLPGIPGSSHEPSLVRRTGILERCGAYYCLGRTVVDFGPAWYVDGSVALHDYDDDGTRDRVAGELSSLLGTEVLLETDGGTLDEDVYTINGMPFRDAQGQLPALEPHERSEPSF
jgi:two-component system, OmpR family, sensor histidine kinase MprB